MSDARPSLDQISTRWQSINDPLQFVMRYALALQNYLTAMLKDGHAAEEVAQDFMVRVQQQGFPYANPERGRFRDYLKRALRNAALNHLQRGGCRGPGRAELVSLEAAADVPQAADQAWIADWRGCLLKRAWRALDDHQRRAPGNLFCTVLRLATDYPNEESTTLAARAGALAGRPMTAEAFRKQLSRSRRLFAELLATEVAQTLDNPTLEQVEEELGDLGLLAYVRDLLPADWHTRRLALQQ